MCKISTTVQLSILYSKLSLRVFQPRQPNSIIPSLSLNAQDAITIHQTQLLKEAKPQNETLVQILQSLKSFTLANGSAFISTGEILSEVEIDRFKKFQFLSSMRIQNNLKHFLLLFQTLQNFTSQDCSKLRKFVASASNFRLIWCTQMHSLKIKYRI